MTDPLDVLSTPDVPIDPSPAFAADLRARLVRALATGDTVDVPENGLRQGDISYVTLAVPDLGRAGRLLRRGPRLGGRRRLGRPRRTGHQHRADGRAVGCVTTARAPGRSPPVVPGRRRRRLRSRRSAAPAAAPRTSRSIGGTRSRPQCTDTGRSAVLAAPVRGRMTAPRHKGFPAGPISYVSLLVPDGDAARAFYAAVLGWTYEDGDPRGHHTGDGDVVGGELGSADHVAYGAVLSYTVTDIADAVATVRSAGGAATDPEQRPYALSSQCVDDQGVPF